MLLVVIVVSLSGSKPELPKLVSRNDGLVPIQQETRHPVEEKQEPGSKQNQAKPETVDHAKLQARLLGELRGHKGGATYFFMQWSPDGSKLASASPDGTVRVWDPATFKQSALLPVKTPTAIAWRPDGNELAIGSMDHPIRFWDPQTDRSAFVDDGMPGGIINGLSWKPDGSLLAAAQAGNRGGSANCQVVLLDPKKGAVVKTLPYGRRFAVFSPDGARLACDGPNSEIHLLNGATFASALELEMPTDRHAPLRHLAFSEDGHYLLSYCNEFGRLWDASNGKELQLVKRRFIPLPNVAWKPKSRVFSTTNSEGLVFHDCVTRASCSIPISNMVPATVIAWRPDGWVLATADPRTWVIQLWGLYDGQSQSGNDTGQGSRRN